MSFEKRGPGVYRARPISALTLMLVLAGSARLARTAPAPPDPPVETASARVIRETGCTVDDEFYRDYILGLGKTIGDLLKDYEILYGADVSRLPRLQTISPRTVVGLNDSRGAVEQLWASICEVESYVPWLEQARTGQHPAVADGVLFLQRLANASVTGLRNQLVDVQSCDVASPSSTPANASASTDLPVTGASSPATATATGGGTSPEPTTLPTVDMAVPCAQRLQLLRPQPQQSTAPYPLPAILDGMLVAVARLDAVVKRDFSS